MSKLVAITPRLSEKAYSLSEERRTYVFDVPKNANKLTVTKAVEGQYNVGVVNVSVSAVAGKPKRTIKRGGRVIHKSHRAPVYKAYVTLKEGDSLPFFTPAETNKKADDKKTKKGDK